LYGGNWISFLIFIVHREIILKIKITFSVLFALGRRVIEHRSTGISSMNSKFYRGQEKKTEKPPDD